jgi:uncharacterized surface protein with fasciclin (FAS1) repeats
MRMRTKMLAAALAAPALLLAACSDGDAGEETTTAEVSTQTLATMLAQDSELSDISRLLGDAGLQELFDGNAPYTVLAPTNGAFAPVLEALPGEESQAARVAVIREHILPGYLSTADIEDAIRNSPDGSVEMQTMGGQPLTFALAGDSVQVTAGDGSTATFQTGELLAGNGVAIPIDGVLKSLDAAE